MAPDLVSGKVQVTNGHDTVDSSNYNSSAALKSSDFKSINSSFLEESTTYNSSSVHNTLHSLKRDAYKSRDLVQPCRDLSLLCTVGHPVIRKVLKIRILGVPLACLGSR